MSDEDTNSKSTCSKKKPKPKKEYSQFSATMEAREKRLQLKEENRRAE
jgi:hypothetical protein